MPFQNDLYFNIIYPSLPATDKTQIIQSLAWSIGRDPEFLKIADTLLDSAALAEQFSIAETLQSSAIGDGVAVLHLSSPYLTKSCKILAKLGAAIDWQADDDKHVDLVGVVLSPCAHNQNETTQSRNKGLHLQDLSRVSRLLLDQKIASSIRKAVTTDDIRLILEPIRLEMLAA